MQIGKQVVTKDVLEKLEAKIGNLHRSIEDARIISRGDKDGLKLALERFKNYRTWVMNEMASNYRKLNHVRVLRNMELAGQEWALTMVISTFENSKADISMYGKDLEALEKQLNEWKKLPVRE